MKDYNLLGHYRNGNYKVMIFNDGTKMRYATDDVDQFMPAFAENCDVKITDKCSQNCSYCYEGCSAHGKHGDILNQKWVDTLHPYTELALNGNDMDHPQLIPFLKKLKRLKVFANITVNQYQLHDNLGLIQALQEDGLLYGIGVSFVRVTEDLFRDIRKLDNVILHVIAGIMTPEELGQLFDHDLSILILGYKTRGRGINYSQKNLNKVVHSLDYFRDHIMEICDHFATVSFDNLALDMLDMKKHFSEDEWENIYMGDDGTTTFYIDMVEHKYACNSVSNTRYDILDSVDDMFEQIRETRED